MAAYVTIDEVCSTLFEFSVTDIEPVIEELHPSIGMNYYLNSRKQENFVYKLMTALLATVHLESEMDDPNTVKKSELKEALHYCYQTLLVEAGLPNELRSISLPHSRTYYSRRIAETERAQ